MLQSRDGSSDGSAARGRLGRMMGRSSRVRETTDDIDARAVLESLDSAVITRRLNGVVDSWNAGAERLYGYAAEEIVGKPYDLIVPAVRQPREGQTVKALVAAMVSDDYITQRLCKDDGAASIRVRTSPITNPAGAIVGVCTVEDRLSAEQARSTLDVDAYLRGAFDDAPIGIALVAIDPARDGRFLQVNRALCELTGYSLEELRRTDVSALVHPHDLPSDVAAMTKLKEGQSDLFQLEQRLLHLDRHAIWTTLSASLIRGTAGNPLYCIRQLQNIEERKRYEGELSYLVEHDPLTGLLNRRGFVRELEHQMAYARRYGKGGAVLFLDVDDFKYINDTLGHSAGDEVISDLARVVDRRLRETDIFARLGGDEFAVLLPDAAVGEARTLAEGLLEAVREGCSVSLGEDRRTSTSIGITTFHEPGKDLTPDDILIDADVAMYAAKEAGKNRMAVASSATRERMRSRVTWAERVRRAVKDGTFELYCQPIVDLATDSITQWELLLRLPGDGEELILPAQFLYTAERSGMILDIDRWVLSQAMRLIAGQRDAGHDLRLEVNLSGRSVGDTELLDLIERELEASAIDPASLILEVTETAAIANMDHACSFATRLQSIGCGFALDDFGAGFGSFYYLKHLPFDYVKIDGEFIRNLPASSTDQLILDSIVQMSRGMGKRTIAEFVGDGDTIEVLKAHGVDYAQGYHLGKPRPVSVTMR
ncbi:MAG TPA: EAL domain-containing protein [Solirubrobacteraceae bacterium]|jgi:diguanylate cyclase (GGDEF)-like protein/PAS domain S-box-containing protein|nr:EAL domain-containing protein [Solirubrobacteraceae bacterium]